MQRFTHIICLMLILTMGLVSYDGVSATETTAMADCCPPGNMHMMQANDEPAPDPAPDNECMDAQDCPPGGLCCDHLVAPATGMMKEPAALAHHTARTLLSYKADLPLRAAPPSQIAPPPIT